VRTFLEYVDSLPWVPGQLDTSSHHSFLRAVTLKVSDAEALAAVAARIKGAGCAVRLGKLRHQLACSHSFVHSQPSQPDNYIAPARPLLAPNRALVARVTPNVDAVIDAAWLRAHSPRRGLLGMSPVEFLGALFYLGEHVAVFTDPRSQGELYVNLETKRDPRKLDHLRRGHDGVWFMIQPLDGQRHMNARTGGASQRSEESVTAWRYAILESDSMEQAEWLKILVQLPLPIAAIYSSGGASVHALVRVNADSKAHWDAMMRGRLMAPLSVLGADPKALTAVRLSRLPQCWRGATGRLQELMYLNPEPENKPLWTSIKTPMERSRATEQRSM
jgi:hypothetical protein